jgi:hypothetical protein
LKASLVGQGVTRFLSHNEVYLQEDSPSLLFRIWRWAMEFNGELNLKCAKTGLSAIVVFKDKVEFSKEFSNIFYSLFFVESGMKFMVTLNITKME